jgi:hypothetical protein
MPRTKTLHDYVGEFEPNDHTTIKIISENAEARKALYRMRGMVTGLVEFSYQGKSKESPAFATFVLEHENDLDQLIEEARSGDLTLEIIA